MENRILTIGIEGYGLTEARSLQEELMSVLTKKLSRSKIRVCEIASIEVRESFTSPIQSHSLIRQIFEEMKSATDRAGLTKAFAAVAELFNHTLPTFARQGAGVVIVHGVGFRDALHLATCFQMDPWIVQGINDLRAELVGKQRPDITFIGTQLLSGRKDPIPPDFLIPIRQMSSIWCGHAVFQKTDKSWEENCKLSCKKIAELLA